MVQPNPPKRTYRSTRRKAQAQETRRQILAAARKLFIERGYNGATIEAIAQEAGVATETVFAIFGNKRSILTKLMDIAVGGDDLPIPLLQRPGPQNVLHQQDPARQLHLFALDIATILERVAPLFEVLRMAAKTEPDIAELLNHLLEERLHNMEVFATHIAAPGGLRKGMAAARAAENIWALSSPELFSLLTGERGWSMDQYSQWLADSLIRVLLP